MSTVFMAALLAVLRDIGNINNRTVFEIIYIYI